MKRTALLRRTSLRRGPITPAAYAAWQAQRRADDDLAAAIDAALARSRALREADDVEWAAP